MENEQEVPKAETGLLETHGVRQSIEAYIFDIGADALTLACFVLGAWLPLWATVQWDVPFKTGIRIYSLIFIISVFLVACGYVSKKVYHGILTTADQLTPPHVDPSITFTIPQTEADETGYIAAKSVPRKAALIGTVFLLCMSLWIGLVVFGLMLVKDPVGQVANIYSTLPSWFSTPLLESISNITGVSVDTIVEQTERPASVTILGLMYGPLFLFGVLSTWNFMYALQLTARSIYRTL